MLDDVFQGIGKAGGSDDSQDAEKGADGLTDAEWLKDMYKARAKKLKFLYAVAIFILVVYSSVGWINLPQSPLMPFVTSTVCVAVDMVIFRYVVVRKKLCERAASDSPDRFPFSFLPFCICLP